MANDTNTAASVMKQLAELVEKTVAALDELYDEIETGVQEGADTKELYFVVDENTEFSDARFEILNIHQWAKLPSPQFRTASEILNDGEAVGSKEYYDYLEALSTKWKSIGESRDLEPKKLLDTMMEIMGTGEIFLGIARDMLKSY